MVSGASKASAAAQVLQGKFDPVKYPAQLIKSISGKTIWYFDKAAAKELTID